MNALDTLRTHRAPAVSAPAPAAAQGALPLRALTPRTGSALVQILGTRPLEVPRRVRAAAGRPRATGWRDRLRLWWSRMQERQELAAMGERELRDIGITRSEAGHEAHKWFWQD